MLERLTCRECGEFLENTPSGLYSACPVGHGKLHPPLDVDDRREIRVAKAERDWNRTLNGLPVAKRADKPGVYMIDGKPYRRVDTITLLAIRGRLERGLMVATCAYLSTGYGEFKRIDDDE